MTHKFYGNVDVETYTPQQIIADNPTIAYDEHIYNLQNRLARIKKYDTNNHQLTDVVEYEYNDNGIRVAKINDPGGAAEATTTYLIDAYNHTGYAQVLEEWTVHAGGTTATLTTYTIGDDVLSQQDSDWSYSGSWTQDLVHKTQYLLYDGHGSTRQWAEYDTDVTIPEFDLNLSHYNYL